MTIFYEDDEPLAHEDHVVAFDDEGDQPLVRPASRKGPPEERRDPATDDGNLAPSVLPRPPPAEPVQRRKAPPEWQDPAATLEREVSGNSHGRTEDVSILSKKAQGEALRNIINKLFDESNLRDHHLKHYHRSTAKFKTRTIHMDVPGNFYDVYQRVVKTCPFCSSIKPRPERFRVSGLLAE